jgi:hypothetical protein
MRGAPTSLFGQGVLSREQHEQIASAAQAMRATVAADTAAVENARLSLAYTEIRAPIAGRRAACSCTRERGEGGGRQPARRHQPCRPHLRLVRGAGEEAGSDPGRPVAPGPGGGSAGGGRDDGAGGR